jgi:uncharacterized membrane protein
MQTHSLDHPDSDLETAPRHSAPTEGAESGRKHGGFGWEDGESLRVVAERRSRVLGLFSVALGISELAAPEAVTELIGIEGSTRRRNVLRALGTREILTGLGILAKPESAGPLWARVAGDALDLALLGAALTDSPKRPVRLAAATGAVLGIAALDIFSAARLSRKESIQKWVLPIHVTKSITINRSPEFVYEFWRDLENLPRFMAHLESVRQDSGGSVWRAKGPAGTTIEWRAEITLDRPNEAIAWRSLEGAMVANRGVVRFKPAPGGRGTEVHVELKYDPPAGAIGAAIAKLFGEEPASQIAGDLRRLKQVLETGSVVHSDASIHRGVHPARPAAEGEQTQLVGSEEVER